MSTTEEISTEESPSPYGIAAADRIVEEHRAKVAAQKAASSAAQKAASSAAQKAAEDDEEDDGDDAPQPKGQPAKKRTVGQKMQRLRAERAQLRADLEALKSKPAPASFDAESFLRDPIAFAEANGVDAAALLEAVQKRALSEGGLPPAVSKALRKASEDLEALRSDNEELRKKWEEREATRAYESAVRALQAEATNVSKYPELEGYEWDQLEPAIDQAIEYLSANGRKSATPGDVLGLVNAAFKAHHERVTKTLSKRKAAPAPPPPAPAKKAKERPELPTVTPGKRGKVRLPTMEEIEQRVARASMPGAS